MPAKNPMIETIVALLPADGSPRTYDQWKADIVTAGHYDAIPLTRNAKREGAVEYFFDKSTGESVLSVRRVVS